MNNRTNRSRTVRRTYFFFAAFFVVPFVAFFVRFVVFFVPFVDFFVPFVDFVALLVFLVFFVAFLASGGVPGIKLAACPVGCCSA